MIKESRILFFLLIFLVGYIFTTLQITAFFLAAAYIINLFVNSSKLIAFREFTLTMYAINYLFSPSIMYNYNDADFLPYHMKCPIDQYFTNAISGIFALHIGMYFFKTEIFQTKFLLVKIQSLLNERILKVWVILGLSLSALISYTELPAEIVFFVLLLSGLRYVGLFGLLSLNAKKHKNIIVFTILFEFYLALSNGFFHDLLIWIIFFGLYYVYIKKVNIATKVIGMLLLVFMAYLIQTIKMDYRSVLWSGKSEGVVNTFSDVAKKKTNEAGFFSKEQLLQTLVRVNQGWIAASTFDYMDRTQKFAGTSVLEKYIESAVLPRFLAPNKLNAGDKVIFNEYSGHFINNNTSMGLGILADGYVAYGYWGVVLFCFGLGLLFNLVFKTVGVWSKVSPFFILLLFPLLYYAVRPDCELQVTLGQLVKGTFTFWLVVRYYNKYFTEQTRILKRIEEFQKRILARKIGVSQENG